MWMNERRHSPHVPTPLLHWPARCIPGTLLAAHALRARHHLASAVLAPAGASPAPSFLAVHALQAHHMSAASAPLHPRRRITRATGATTVMTLADMEGNETFDASCLGHAEEVREDRPSGRLVPRRALYRGARPCALGGALHGWGGHAHGLGGGEGEGADARHSAPWGALCGWGGHAHVRGRRSSGRL